MEQPEKKIFEDFPEVDCNRCETYWNSQCDGASVNSPRPCKHFKAVRRVNIPEELKSTQKSLRRLWKLTRFLWILQIIVNLLEIFKDYFGG